MAVGGCISTSWNQSRVAEGSAPGRRCLCVRATQGAYPEERQAGGTGVVLLLELAAPLCRLGCRPPSCSDAGRSLSPADIPSIPSPALSFSSAGNPGGPFSSSLLLGSCRALTNGFPTSNTGSFLFRRFLLLPLMPRAVHPCLQLEFWSKRTSIITLEFAEAEPLNSRFYPVCSDHF